MIPRALIIGIELLGGLLAVVVIAFVALFWRLSTGPIPLDYATPYIERALSTDSASLEAKIQNTELVWAGWGDAFDIRIYNAAILGSGGFSGSRTALAGGTTAALLAAAAPAPVL